MTTYLLDSNVVIARSAPEHIHHEAAVVWMETVERFAVSPAVEGSLVRFLVRTGRGAPAAVAGVRQIRNLDGYEFWPDSLSYADADLSRVRGHSQVTDAYLVRLAESHGDALLATFDKTLASTYPNLTVLVPGS